MTSSEYVAARAWVHVQWVGQSDGGNGMTVGGWHAVRPGGDGVMSALCNVGVLRSAESPTWPADGDSCEACGALAT